MSKVRILYGVLFKLNKGGYHDVTNLTKEFVVSRSYKEPWATDYHRSKSYYKRLANRKIRKIPIDEDISNGRSFRKYYCSYDICDYKFRYNPHPVVYSWGGELKLIEPCPLYKYNRK